MVVGATLSELTCPKCGIMFAIPDWYMNSRRKDHEIFSCPNGHDNYYPHETGEEKAKRLAEHYRRRLMQEQSNHDQTRAELESTERRRRAAKGQLTKTKNRIGRGVCPCCNRSFENLQRHMETKHPSYADGE